MWLPSTGPWAVAKYQTRLNTGAMNNVRLAVPRVEVHSSEVAHAAISVDKMPTVRVDPVSCIQRPLMGVGQARSLRPKEGRRVIG